MSSMTMSRDMTNAVVLQMKNAW
uniref:Uncharacterized protein n=1 Tax=Arundo donax TaxID=35708 RepID=A0A0A8Z1J4_ARUDO